MFDNTTDGIDKYSNIMALLSYDYHLGISAKSVSVSNCDTKWRIFRYILDSTECDGI